MALLMGFGYGYAQKIEISGTVTDQQGAPVIGVTVLVEGAGDIPIGTTTDVNGVYTIAVPEGATALKFSYIGMNDVVEQINSRTVIDVQMTDSTTVLNEVVVTALGIKKEQKSLSYNVQSVMPEGFDPSGSFVNSLSGKVAGVTINSSSVGVGGSSRVVMRGTKSLTGNNNALYVIDGIPMPNLTSEQPSGVYEGAGQTGDGLASINPDDIESISVLSGPSAAALYGSSAANGVVMITTKKGTQDKLSVSYTNNTTFSRAYIMPSFQNTYGPTEEGSYQSWGEKLATPSSYDPRNFFRTGYNETNSVSLSTGNSRNQTYFSAASTNAGGIIHGNDYDRYNFTVRNTANFLDEKMTLDLNFMYSDIKEQNMIAQGQYMNPIVPVYLFPAGDDFSRLEVYERYDASRNMKVQYWPYESDLTMQNPYWITERDKFINHKDRFMTSAQLKYDIAKWINISGRVKLDKSVETHEKKFAASTLDLFASKYGYYSKNDITTRQIYAEALLNINKYFCDDKLSLTATLGTSLEDVNYAQDMYGGKLASVANLYTYGNVNQSTAESSQSGYHKQKQAIFLNAQLGYRSMVYLDVTGRNDWTSTLSGSDTRSFFYPTVGLSGIVTEILGMNSKVLPYWKVRVSYSEVGNEPEPFLTIPTYELASGTPVTQTRMPNTNLEPERTKSWEVGTNLYLFDSRLKIDATYYYSKTYNQFFEPALSSSSGYSSVILNSGRVDNEGVELSARYTDDYGPVRWSTYFTYSTNRNEIVELLTSWKNPNTGEIVSLDEMEVGGTGGVKNILKKGGSMGDIYVTSLRTDEHGAIYVHPTDQTVVADYTNYIYAGDTAPRHNMSWGNDLSWKGFNLNFLFTARLGGVVVSQTQAVMDYYGISQATADARDRGGALVNGKLIPAKEFYQTIGGGTGVMSQYVYDATNVRLSELTFGYDFPVQKWCKWIKGLNVSFVGRNLWMLYKKAPFDPELTANTGTYNQGIDYFMQPSTRTLGFSVKVKF
ncbi:SusC/RagA family TonB-linked outer membrane protein [uncultured Alistipes sp.]|uniref:SusC/RagA family TonB-linked outer membrane protein n=1 Tax=uncultured Alistipes sp. TaxID=538949 RepID=UPI0025DC7832|nr:SusC/RagA family TonB-linked outer membrane protein [uncultured Alistipes sp.]